MHVTPKYAPEKDVNHRGLTLDLDNMYARVPILYNSIVNIIPLLVLTSRHADVTSKNHFKIGPEAGLVIEMVAQNRARNLIWVIFELRHISIFSP